MKRSILKLTLFAVAGFAMLVALGSWQLQRLAWKEGLIAKVDARAHAEPVGLQEAIRRAEGEGDIEYMRVRAEGHFLNDRERHLYTVLDGAPGWRIVTPLQTPGGAIVMVDRGFVPDKLKDASKRREGQIGGETEVVGLARAPGEANPFTPESDLGRNRWFWRDLDGMAASVLDSDQRARVVPFFLEAGPSAVPGGWPKGGVTRIEFPNRHLEYAVTWFGLALALLVVYAAILRRWWRHDEFT